MNEILSLYICDSKEILFDKFKCSLEIGSILVAEFKDFSKESNCFIWGEGSITDYYHKNDSIWTLIATNDKFSHILYIGDREETIQILQRFAPNNTRINFARQSGQNDSIQTAGNYSVQSAENNSSQTAGDYSVQTAKDICIQTAGHNSNQITSNLVRQVAGDYSVQSAGNNSIQIAGIFSTQISGNDSKQTAGYYSSQITGNNSIQTSGIGTIQTTRWMINDKLHINTRIVDSNMADKSYYVQDGIWTEV